MTKKVGGLALKIIFSVLQFIPYVGPIFKFLKDFGPAIYSFIMVQILLIWDKARKTAAEAKKQNEMGQKATGAKAAKALILAVKGAAKKVKPFKG